MRGGNNNNINAYESNRQDQEMAERTLVPHGRHRAPPMHPLLYPVVRSDALAHQRRGKRGALDHPLWLGQDLPVWGTDDPRRGGLPTGKELDTPKEGIVLETV